MPRPMRITLWIFLSLGLTLAALAGTVWWILTGSQAQLAGTVTSQHVSDRASIERDAQGLVTIQAQSRADIAFSLGFVHAQERFFQMDLLRRNSAGELSELFGDVAANFDARIRIHQFRTRSEGAFQNLPDAHRKILEAYSHGVNEGLDRLRSNPFEYHLLQTSPTQWHPTDTLLVVFSMYMDLQDEWGETERSLTALYELLPTDWADFLVPMGGRWDATLDGGDAIFSAPIPERPLSSFQSENLTAIFKYRDSIETGSNNWSVGGALTTSGSALVADDMHLGLDVPNIWFRASWYLPNNGQRITGATLPGTPLMIVGSNEKIAWGFTNAYGDFMDVVRLQTNAEGSEYFTPDGWERFGVSNEIIKIKGQSDHTTQVKTTRWGPVIGEDHFGNLIALRWVAHDSPGLNLNLIQLEQADDVSDAMTIAPKTGIPGQNLVVGDRDGNIAWSVMGAIPQRFGFNDGLAERQLADWSQGTVGWEGMVKPENYPQIVNPENHRIWSANARMLSGIGYQTVGDGLGALGARQQQIRDRLFEHEQFDEQQFLDIQLDDEARFLARWHSLLSDILNQDPLANNPLFEPMRTQLAAGTLHADVQSTRYLLVKRYREQVIDRTVGHLFNYVANKTQDFWGGTIDGRVEYATWRLITEQPERHIPWGYESWHQFLYSLAAEINSEYEGPLNDLSEVTWGNENKLNIRHPMSNAVPFLSLLLDMPSTAMPGDTFMPRVQGPDFGATQRMAVSPGNEEDGYFHMATGQSGHPLSPFYRAGHDDWVNGYPSPFLPGEPEFLLEIIPE